MRRLAAELDPDLDVTGVGSGEALDRGFARTAIEQLLGVERDALVETRPAEVPFDLPRGPDPHPRAGKSAHKVKTSAVRVIDAARGLQRGDACVAPDFGKIEPCTVKRILEGGLAYEVTFEGDRLQEFELGRVAPKPRPAK